MDQLPAAREALEELADRLEGELATSGRNARIAVVRGWQAASSAEPEAQALRASGAGWDGVALGVTGWNFWDLHIGPLASEDADGAWRPRVGLHWRNAVDDVARPLATELTSVDLIHFSPVTDEYSAGETTSVFDLPFARAASLICYDLAFPELMRVFALMGATVALMSTAWPMCGNDRSNDYHGWSMDIAAQANAFASGGAERSPTTPGRRPRTS